jgi:SnoaL-like domain
LYPQRPDIADSAGQCRFRADIVAKIPKDAAAIFPPKNEQATIADQRGFKRAIRIACEFGARRRGPHIIESPHLRVGGAPMNQHAGKNGVPPSVGADVGGIETLLNRNLSEVFGEGDPARRRRAIGELYTEDCVLYVPLGAFVGYDALDKFAGDLRVTHPHYVYTPHGSPQVLHNSGRLAWGSGPKGETPAYTGVDFIIARDGKIAALYVYLDSPPT